MGRGGATPPLGHFLHRATALPASSRPPRPQTLRHPLLLRPRQRFPTWRCRVRTLSTRARGGRGGGRSDVNAQPQAGGAAPRRRSAAAPPPRDRGPPPALPHRPRASLVARAPAPCTLSAALGNAVAPCLHLPRGSWRREPDTRPPVLTQSHFLSCRGWRGRAGRGGRDVSVRGLPMTRVPALPRPVRFEVLETSRAAGVACKLECFVKVQLHNFRKKVWASNLEGTNVLEK